MEMSQSHAEKILDGLHDQYLKGIDCDVILRARNHVGDHPTTSTTESLWTDLHCHKNVLRAASSFFDRIFSHNFSFENSVLEEGVEGTLVKTQTDGRYLLQITFSTIDSHSVQSLVNFEYTGFVHVDTD